MSRHSLRRVNPALALTAAAVLALCAGACERRDEHERAIRSASIRLDTLTAGGAVPTGDPAQARKEYTAILNDLRDAAGQPGATGASAAGLSARAQGGLGDLAAGDAAMEEHAFGSQLKLVRAGLDRWYAMSSMAAALEGYDPAKDIADLDSQIRDRAAEMESLQADKRQQEGRVADIRRQADEARERARQERDRETALRGRAEGGTQVARADLITQAVQARRAADAQERQAAEHEAVAAKEVPRITELDNQLARLARQIELLKAAQTQARDRAAANKRQADQARAEASAAGKGLTDALAALAADRAKADAPTEEARKQYQAAIGSVKKMTQGTTAREGKAAASGTLGSFHQALGDLLGARARAMAQYAGLLRAVADARPAVPGADGVAAQADKATTDMETARTEAREAYAAALAAFGNAGSTPAIKAKMERVTEALKDLAGIKPEAPAGETPPAPAPDAPAGEGEPAANAGEGGAAGEPKPAASAATADAAKVESEVKDAAARFASLLAARDIDGLRGAIEFADDVSRTQFDAMFPTIMAHADLDKAAKAKFGKDLVTLAKDSQDPAVKMNPAVGMLSTLGPQTAKVLFTEEQARSSPVTVRSDSEAVLTLPTDKADDPTVFLKRDGAWKLVAKSRTTGQDGGDKVVTQLMPKLKGLFDEVRTSTDAGKYSSGDDLLKDFGAKLMPIIASVMGGQNGGPGGADAQRPGRRPGTRPAGTPAPGGSGGGDKPGSGG